MTMQEQMKYAVRTGDSQRIRDAVERWLTGTLTTDELAFETATQTGNSKHAKQALNVAAVER